MKKYLSLILALGICMSMCVFPAAAISANEAENEVLTEDEFTELLTAEMSSNEFGGLYYEGDTLVVNVIASQKATSLRPQLAQKAPEDIDVEYRTVTYSLSELERIKNFLTGYMSDYSIMMLDANEITNQVDISLKDYSDDNIESIKAAVLSHGGKTDYLNFIDDSNNVIRSTVGYETDNNASPFSLYVKFLFPLQQRHPLHNISRVAKSLSEITLTRSARLFQLRKHIQRDMDLAEQLM